MNFHKFLCKIQKMSENLKKLEAVQQEIKDLMIKESNLKKKYLRGPITGEQKIELDSLNIKLQELQKQKKLWQEQINNPVAIKKSLVSFKKATPEDCMKSDGLALDLCYIEPFAYHLPTLHIPQQVQLPIPSAFLCEHLMLIQEYFILDTQKACTMMIDALLLEVLKNEANENLWGFCNVSNNWEGAGIVYHGQVDFMLGSSRSKSTQTMDSNLIVVQAKKQWPDSAIYQVICEAGCLLKKRLEAGKNTPVFAVLTNGNIFRFFAIDIDGIVYASEIEVLKLGPDGTYHSSTSLAEILRWFYWFMTCIKSISSSESRPNDTQDHIHASLAQLRSCFGPTNDNYKRK